jgi:release factor glutamine methyltransferase
MPSTIRVFTVTIGHRARWVAYSPSPMAPTTTPTTIRDLLRRAQTALGEGTASVLDAELLVSAATDLSRSALLAHPEAAVAVDAIGRFEAWLARRASGEPMAYLLGHWGFWSLELVVRPGVLVPRPETEGVVERAMLRLERPTPRILDLGTGSGAIALALASEHPTAEVTATEASEAAFEVARENAAATELEVELLLGDATDWFLPVTARRFDLIVSNPPYVAEGAPELEVAVAAHEPPEALLAGADGLDALRAIISGAPDHLAAGGWLIVEHGFDQGARVRALFADAGFDEVATYRDLAGHERVTEGRV